MTAKLSTQEKLDLMEPHMSVSWDDIDSIFDHYMGGSRSNTKRNWAHDWASAKYETFKRFGNKLKLSKDVENVLGEKAVLESFKEHIIAEDKLSASTLYRAKLCLLVFSYEELKKNECTKDRLVNSKKINKGMKISKSLKFFVEDKEQLDILQVAFSMFRQSLEAKGHIEFSIDPIDILCMSLNKTRQWRSCHSIIDGEYSSGAIAYLLDKSSVIGQVIFDKGRKNGNPTDLVPDKIWRQMVYLDEDLNWGISSRQYPSSNKAYSEQLIDLIHTSLDVKEKLSKKIGDGESLSGTIRNRGDHHYNDISHYGSEDTVIFNINPEIGKMYEEMPDFIVGVSTIYGADGEEIYDEGQRNGPYGNERYYGDDDDYYY